LREDVPNLDVPIPHTMATPHAVPGIHRAGGRRWLAWTLCVLVAIRYSTPAEGPIGVVRFDVFEVGGDLLRGKNIYQGDAPPAARMQTLGPAVASH